MKEKLYEYAGEEVTVSYDLKRCIHAAACVKGLPGVFDPAKKPWVSPDEAATDTVAEVILQCPTGALKYTLSDGKTAEVPEENTVDVVADGPLYVRGNMEITGAEGTVVLKDTRVALCRCGASENKPLCDGRHNKVGFADAAGFENPKVKPAGEDASAGLTIRLAENGPLLVEGVHTVYTAGRAEHVEGEKCALCRCGASKNKPFCDGAHKAIGFTG
ncbi:MAG: CDGSH iron-sulfur domain-containing protein [Bacteroidota bacterium]